MELQICRPEAEGLSSSAILAFVEAAETELDALHSLMILRHGHIVTQGWWQPYGASYNHRLFSLSKSFTSTAIGLAVSEGLLGVDDLVVSFFADALPQEPSANLLAMRIRDLLSMTSGHNNDTLGRLIAREDGQWIRAFLALPVEHKPGTHFVYNTGATYMLAAILQQVTGETLQDYLQPRLFGPLGIQNPKWLMSPEGVHVGGWGLRVTTEDIARFGQLYLQKGQWEGKQLVPEEWVDQATLRQTSNGSNPESDWEQGYGYQFWRCRHNAYRGDGAFGQFCLVMPDQDMVVAITSGLKNMQSVLDLIWKYVLPAIQNKPLPPNDQDYDLLQEKMGSLSLPVVQGLATSSLAADVSGQVYVCENDDSEIQSVAFRFKEGACEITLKDAEGEHSFGCGYQTWVRGETAFDSEDGLPQVIAAAGAWTTQDTYTVKICFYETPFCSVVTIRFDGDQVLLHYEVNVGFGGVKQIDWVGKSG